MKINKITLSGLLISLMMFLNVCESDLPESQTLEANYPDEKVIIEEVFHTDRDQGDNVDSPAFWKGDDGEYWLLATAKVGNAIIIFDARDGRFIQRFDDQGKLSRPNGIAVMDDLLLIVERNNHRISIFTLPEFELLGYVGEAELKFPYGIAIDYLDNEYHMYITDNYEMEDEESVPAAELGARAHYFTFKISDGEIQSKHIKAFGDTQGSGALHKVESILIDRHYNRLFIADEQERNIKIYNPEGEFTGDIIHSNYFNYEPEGIVLFDCPEDASGYYILTDQHVHDNCFRVFDRKSLNYIGSFGGKITSNTDGVALTQESVGDKYPYGVFYPVHDDGSVTAIDWVDIADAFGLKKTCN